jgi:mRNA-degrading endonuclease toxin of MazEF toxin-antitoxin module
MLKNFDEWNKLKKKIDNSKNFLKFNEREVWFVNMGLNVGFEQDGKNKDYLRPVIIFRKFNKHLFWAMPLTKNIKNNKYYFNLKIRKNYNSAILSQIKSMDSKRLRYRIAIINEKDLFNLSKKLQELFPRVFLF